MPSTHPLIVSFIITFLPINPPNRVHYLFRRIFHGLLSHALQSLLSRFFRLIRHIRVLQCSKPKKPNRQPKHLPQLSSAKMDKGKEKTHAFKPPATFPGFLSPPDDVWVSPPANSLSKTAWECCLDSSDVSVQN